MVKGGCYVKKKNVAFRERTSFDRYYDLDY